MAQGYLQNIKAKAEIKMEKNKILKARRSNTWSKHVDNLVLAVHSLTIQFTVDNNVAEDHLKYRNREILNFYKKI